jgi:hypothetical protein
MNGPNFMHGWVAFCGSLATIALILTAFGLMLRIVKPGDALKNIGAILGIAIALMLIPCILVSDWSAMSFWQQIGLVALGITLWQWLRPRRRTRNTRHD